MNRPLLLITEAVPSEGTQFRKCLTKNKNKKHMYRYRTSDLPTPSSIHPLVRTHPATGEKALYVNPQFTRYIVGFKQEESDYLLKFLYDHIALSADIQARVRWQPGTVVVWDNRVTAHTALLDWDDGQRRHIARITPQAERPYET